MATILISAEDSRLAERLAATVEGLGHTALQILTTENVAEDVRLNDVDLVITGLSTSPFDGLETCDLLRADPDVAARLPILLATDEGVDPKRIEKAGISEVVATEVDAAVLNETLVRCLGEAAVPDRWSGPGQ